MNDNLLPETSSSSPENQANPAQVSRLIVTRPLARSDQLYNQLAALTAGKIECRQLPLISIKPVNFIPPELSGLDGIIFISGNAVRHFFDSFLRDKIIADSSARNLKSHMPDNLQYLAVGESTARQIKQYGLSRVDFPRQMNAEGLLQLPQLHAISGQRWLLVKGDGGRKIIAETLVERGAQVIELDVYQRKLPDLESQAAVISAQPTDPTWLVTSAEALNHLHRILGLTRKPGHQTKVIISSDRLALLAKQKGFTIIAQSSGASESQLIQCVKMLLTSQSPGGNGHL